MRPYPSYKDSEVEWIGEIPSGWARKKLGYIVNLQGRIGYKGYKKTDFVDEGEGCLVLGGKHINSSQKIDLSNPDFLSWDKYYESPEIMVKKGDMIISQRGSLGKVVFIDEDYGEMTINPSLVLVNQIKENPIFLWYYLQSNHIFTQINLIGSITTIPMLSQEEISTFQFLIPPKREQIQIVSFLDHKTQKIDELIEKTEKKIELLKEKRTALINHCVTKGLNPPACLPALREQAGSRTDERAGRNVEMKDSGVKWIGEIPSGWTISKLKYDTLIPVRYGLNISSDRYTENGVRFIRITDLDDCGELNPDNGKYLIESDVDVEFLLDKYDLLLCRSGHTVGKSYLHLQDGMYSSGGYLVRFNFGDYFSSKFVFYTTKTDFYLYWIRLNTITSTIENVNGEKYSNMVYPKPTNTEQHQIVEYLDEQTQKIDTTIEKETQRIELLKEYRQSLISEVVTGKIDVRGYNSTVLVEGETQSR
ncbi:MAG: restriction endonuclease subunit S [Candidatus Marinimicrobia bacterium]|nr:restriction endonuclease subunit S [Candidatus Neomarinimicrobiota bacterium]